MFGEPTRWSESGLVDHFGQVHEHMGDRCFCFVLGAGASVSSGIKAGGTLAHKWLKELHLREGEGLPFEQWATVENLGIEDFDASNPGAFYPQIFVRRFGKDSEEGYAYLEHEMQSARPAFGYSVLARILSEERHKVVITTNFDNLVADALSIHSRAHPLVAGHESLANFVRARPRRPLVAKVHRDLFLDPVNDPEGTEQLAEAWKRSLKALFATYTPLFIGYGGNDGSLMGFLEELTPKETPGFPIWCFRESEEPPARVINLVGKLEGVLVGIRDFDELMLRLHQRLGYGFEHQELEDRAKERLERYTNQVEELRTRLESADTERARQALAPDKITAQDEEIEATAQAFRDTVKRTKGWWGVQLAVYDEDDLDEKDALFRAGVRKYPHEPGLLGNYAVFLKNERKEMDEAEKFFKRAIEADPNHANHLGNYAGFLKNERKEMDEAEKFFKRAIEADPNHANHLGNYAGFLKNERKEMDEAEKFFKRAIEAAPSSSYKTNARRWTKPRSSSSAPSRRIQIMQTTSATTPFFKRAFLKNERKEMDEAEKFFKRAIEADPNHANNLGNYAGFLKNERKEMDEAEKFFKRAIEADPNGANHLGNYAGYLLALGNVKDGLAAVRRAMSSTDLNQNVVLLTELHFYRLAHGSAKDRTDALDSLRELIEAGVRSPGWDFAGNIRQAQATGHPHVPFLEAVASVVTDRADPSTLDSFDEWTK